MIFEKEQFYSQDDLGRMDRWGGFTQGTSEKVMIDYEQKRLEPLSGIETAKKASAIYEALGSNLGSRLVEPNVVLCIAGMKGLADIPWVELEKQDFEKLEQVKSKLIKSGIFFAYSKDPKGAIGGKTFPVIMSIGNIKGVEKKTKETNIPGVPAYDTRLDEKSRLEWGGRLWKSLEEAKQAGEIQKEVDLQIIFEGILLGYPDQAILDFEKCLREGKIHEDLLEADIISAHPKALKYDGAVPEFDFYPEHKNDQAIVNYTKKARQILKEFYNSDWHRTISEDKDFLAGRDKYNEALKQGTAHLERRSL